MQPSPRFFEQRQATLDRLEYAEIDRPIVGLVRAFNRLPHCFTLQCCYGHFLWSRRQDTRSLKRLPSKSLGGPIEYRMAYLAFCLDSGEKGRDMLGDLMLVEQLNPDCVQFGGSDWFWDRQINSYVLQVQPARFRNRDQATVALQEARYAECVRGRFFRTLGKLVC